MASPTQNVSQVSAKPTAPPGDTTTRFQAPTTAVTAADSVTLPTNRRTVPDVLKRGVEKRPPQRSSAVASTASPAAYRPATIADGKCQSVRAPDSSAPRATPGQRLMPRRISAASEIPDGIQTQLAPTAVKGKNSRRCAPTTYSAAIRATSAIHAMRDLWRGACDMPNPLMIAAEVGPPGSQIARYDAHGGIAGRTSASKGQATGYGLQATD